MTKEELEKQKEELSYLYDSKHKCPGYGCCHSYSDDQKAFEAGFDSAVNLLLPRLEEAELKAEFIKQYLNPADTSFRQMMDTFKELPEDKKEKLINLSRSLANLSDEKKND